MRQQQAGGGDLIEVHNIQLVGMEALWEIVLQARDSVVAQQSQAFLSKLYRRLAQSVLETSLKEVKQMFLETAMKQVEAGIRRVTDHADAELRCSVGDAKHRLQRATQVLLNFLSEFEGIGGPTNKSAWNKRLGQPHHIKIQIRLNMKGHAGPGGAAVFPVTIDVANSSMGDLRGLIASRIEPPIDEKLVQITYMGRIFTDTRVTLRAAKICEGCNVFVNKDTPLEDMVVDSPPSLTAEPGDDHDGQREVSAEELASVTESVRCVVENPALEAEFVKFVFKKKNYDLEGTVMAFVLGESDELREEMREEEEERARQNL